VRVLESAHPGNVFGVVTQAEIMSGTLGHFVIALVLGCDFVGLIYYKSGQFVYRGFVVYGSQV
jgi:hypothetical protein